MASGGHRCAFSELMKLFQSFFTFLGRQQAAYWVMVLKSFGSNLILNFSR